MGGERRQTATTATRDSDGRPQGLTPLLLQAVAKAWTKGATKFFIDDLEVRCIPCEGCEEERELTRGSQVIFPYDKIYPGSLLASSGYGHDAN